MGGQLAHAGGGGGVKPRLDSAARSVLWGRLDALVVAMVTGEGCEGWFLPAEDVVARAVNLIRLIDGEVWRQATGDEEATDG